MQKRGQFYLVAAIIIAAIVLSLVVTTNYSREQEYTELEFLRDEIQIEGAAVLDYSVNNEESDAAIIIRMQDFTQKYIDLESRDKNLYFIFGKKTGLTLEGYQKNDYEVVFNGNAVTSDTGEFSFSTQATGNSAVLIIDGETYSFAMPEEGRVFYFVISKEIDDGNYVVIG